MATYLAHRGITGEAVEVDGALVGQVVKDIEGACRLGPTLFVAKNKVNPLVQLTRHKLTFQGLSKRAEQLEVKGTHIQHEHKHTQASRCKHTYTDIHTLGAMLLDLEDCNSLK